jgi:hypothetical protein
MSSKPSQLRTVDPYASYNSNVANKLTRMLTQNDNVLLSKNSLRLELDTTSTLTTVIVKTGTVFKDDVLIEVTADHVVDFEDPTHYINANGGGGGALGETGYYYVCLEYTYVKSRPAPEVNIKILKPSQRSSFVTSTSLLMLGVVKVVVVGISNGIDLSDPLHNYDPENPDNRRRYVTFYAGTETGLPTFDQFRDQSRVAYDSETDKFWLGYRDNWQEFGTGGSVINIDTTGTVVGQLCYVDASGSAVPAIADSLTTGADIAIKTVGLAVNNSGKALTSGIALDVPVETPLVVTAGDLLYLSSSQAGKVTNAKSSPFFQVVGRALTSGDSSNPIDMIFTPKMTVVDSLVGTIGVLDWVEDGTSGTSYYFDVDISDMDLSVYAIISAFFDDNDDKQIQPSDVQILDSGDTFRVYMPTNAVILNYIISASGLSGGGGSGSGGSGDHALLSHLSFASSGHSGFAAGNGIDAGGSTHDNDSHIDNYITTAEVTYNSLLANGDIGTGATQVSQGDHTHSGLIPSGTVMLFGQASAPTGWTKKTTGFTTNSMIVVSTGAGGGAGGAADARSFDPGVSSVAVGTHSHTTAGHTLTITEMPSHDHRINGNGGSDANSYGLGSSGLSGGKTGAGGTYYSTNSAGIDIMENTGGGGSHTHGATGLSGSHNHTINYSAYNPYYFTVIAATKD